ncbi:helix-turn-helix transcriptional regulator [Streptomyces griseoincarnatus]
MSEKSIQVAEEGRVPRGRMPQSITRIAEALGWPPGSVQQILSGRAPEDVLREGPNLFSIEEAAGGKAQSDRAIGKGHQEEIPRVRMRDLEVEEASGLAQDTFIRQMKRYRKLKGITLGQMAQAIAEVQGADPPGGSLGVDELKRLENGTRLIRGSEGELIAYALGTTVEWLLGSSFSIDAPEELKVPPTAEELEAEAKAMEQRMFQTGARLNVARSQYSRAKEREEEARRQSQWAFMVFDNVSTEMRRLEQQYQYLIGRIDSLRAARGEELIIQTHPVYVDDGE